MFFEASKPHPILPLSRPYQLVVTKTMAKYRLNTHKPKDYGEHIILFTTNIFFKIVSGILVLNNWQVYVEH